MTLRILPLFALLLLGALPPLSTDDLKTDASLVVVVEVLQVFDRVHRRDGTSTDHRYLIEVKVKSVEKGDGARPDMLLYARAWQPAKRPEGWTGPQGQNVVPGPGDVVRFYLRRAKDGGLSLLSPNGVEPMK